MSCNPKQNKTMFLEMLQKLDWDLKNNIFEISVNILEGIL